MARGRSDPPGSPVHVVFMHLPDEASCWGAVSAECVPRAAEHLGFSEFYRLSEQSGQRVRYGNEHRVDAALVQDERLLDEHFVEGVVQRTQRLFCEWVQLCCEAAVFFGHLHEDATHLSPEVVKVSADSYLKTFRHDSYQWGTGSPSTI